MTKKRIIRNGKTVNFGNIYNDSFIVDLPKCDNIYKVSLVLVIGYYDNNVDTPILRTDVYEVPAESEEEAIEICKKDYDKTGFSIWESYATEL